MQAETTVADRDDRLWVDRFAPATLEDMAANRAEASKIIKWLKQWRLRAPGDKQGQPCALLLCGPPGVGKSTAVRIAARAADLQVRELNASDQRSAATLAALADEYTRRADGRAVRPLRFSGSGGDRYATTPVAPSSGTVDQVLVMEEADGLDGNADRGGMKCMTALARAACVPLIFTANLEPSNPALRPLVSVCGSEGVLRFAPFKPEQLLEHLRRVVRLATGRMPGDELARHLIGTCMGDARRLINEAQFALEHRDSGKAGAPPPAGRKGADCADGSDYVPSSNVFTRGSELFLGKGDSRTRLEIGLSNAREEEYLTHAFVYGNYVGQRRTAAGADIGTASRVADTFSVGDLVERELRVRRQYHRVTEELDLLLRTVHPAYMCGFPPGARPSGAQQRQPSLAFPSEVLAGNSRWLAAQRSEKLFHGVAALRTGFRGLDPDTCAVLYQRLRQMLASGQDALAFVNVMEPYGIRPDLWPRFTALALWRGAPADKRIPPAVEKRFVELCKKHWRLRDGDDAVREESDDANASGAATEAGADEGQVVASLGIAARAREQSLAGLLVKRKRVGS